MSGAHNHHSHGHHQPGNYGRAFAIGIGLNIIFVVIEVFYGLMANSSALLADAGHNASDILSLIFAWIATRLAIIKPKGKYTYGLRKTTILVSILNALLLFGAVFFIAIDAIDKFKNPEPVVSKHIIFVAAIGVIINVLTALLFIKGKKDDLNIKGAFLHMMADAAVSLGVVFAGIVIRLTGVLWIDPIMSFLIIIVIVWGTWQLFTDSLDLALDAVPKQVNVEKIQNYLLSLDGVEDLHDLHIWAISTTQIALTAHLIMPNGYDDDFLKKLQYDLKHKFNIGHCTVQVENQVLGSGCESQC